MKNSGATWRTESVDASNKDNLEKRLNELSKEGWNVFDVQHHVYTYLVILWKQ